MPKDWAAAILSFDASKPRPAFLVSSVYWGSIRIVLGLYRDDGKENGKYSLGRQSPRNWGCVDGGKGHRAQDIP